MYLFVKSLHHCLIEISFIKLYLVSIGMDLIITELCYKGIILQKNYRKVTILRPFSYNSFEKFHGNKFGSHSITMLYPI